MLKLIKFPTVTELPSASTTGVVIALFAAVKPAKLPAPGAPLTLKKSRESVVMPAAGAVALRFKICVNKPTVATPFFISIIEIESLILLTHTNKL